MNEKAYTVTINQWHERLGHAALSTIAKSVPKLNGLNIKKSDDKLICDSCMQAKAITPSVPKEVFVS